MKTREVIGSRRCRLASEGGKASANKQAEHHELEGTKAIAQPDAPPRGKCVNKADDWDCELLSGHVCVCWRHRLTSDGGDGDCLVLPTPLVGFPCGSMEQVAAEADAVAR